LKNIQKSEYVWTVPVAAEEIPESGLYVAIEAPAAVRDQLAKLAGVRDLPELSAVFDLVRKGARVEVTGRVSARVGQTCVVTLEPMESVLDEPVDVIFAPAGAAVPHADEEPEPMIDGTLDLGALATEFLLLGIDPYPRKAGVEFAPPKLEDSGERPFAVLETLK
jgi:uncharacterized metal-binding protein YceD (DUF177 family)